MDRHDVTDLPEFFNSLMGQKKNLQDAQARKGQRPTLNHPMALVFQFNMRVTMKDRKETHHRGKYLLVRCATCQDRMTGILAIVQDESSDAVLLQLYHQEQADDPVETIIEEGMFLIIKEPYLKVTSDGSFGLRVDHVSDVEFLATDDGRIPKIWQGASPKKTAMAWKDRGNEFFGKAEYRAAIRAQVNPYTQALDCSPSDVKAHTIMLNRSLAFIKMRSFERALSDIDAAAALSTPTEKALFRKAQALYGLQRFRECCDVLKTLCLEHPDNKTAKSDLARAIHRLAEHTHGRYDFRKMYTEAATQRPPHLGHATYIGPVTIKNSTISPGGRGLFTTKPVSAGDLLFCEKAFAHAHAHESSADANPRNHTVTVLIDTSTDRVSMGTEQEVANIIIRKLYNNPSLASAVTSLHHGSYQSVKETSVDGHPIVDTFLIRRIIALNSFGCPISSRESHLSHVFKSKDGSAFHSSGIWPQASYINHYCQSNCSRSFIGDMMIARATRDLPAGAELTWWYHPPPTEPIPYLERQKILLRTWGFMCKCPMCRDLRDTPQSVIEKRKQLRVEFRTLIPTRRDGQTRSLISGRPVGLAALKKAEGVVKWIIATYKKAATQVPILAVAELQLVLSREWEERGNPLETAKFALAALESHGFVVEGGDLSKRSRGEALVVKEWGPMMGSVIDCWMFLRNAYRLAAPELAATAEGFAKVSYRICMGEDETFHETYGRFG
ncbi:hypothetical protein QBC34DRAFT_357213, partial [Podospora aff. communis PSN243]